MVEEGPSTKGQSPLNSPALPPLDAERLRALFAASNDAFFDVDLASMTIWWSSGISLILGHDPAAIGLRLDAWQGLLHPDDAPLILGSGSALLPDGTSWSQEFRMRRADGTYASVGVRSFVIRDATGTPVHVVGALTDLSELKGREEELREIGEDLTDEMEREHEARRRAELLLRSATTEVLHDRDMRTGRVTYSPNIEELFGHPAALLADTSALMRFVDPVEGQRVREDYDRALASGANSWTSPPFRFQRADGEWIRLLTHVYILRDESGAPIRAVGSTVRIDPSATGAGAARAELTERQQYVLRLVREGRTNKEIAGALGISEQAAKVQVRRLMRKFGAPNRAALAAIR